MQMLLHLLVVGAGGLLLRTKQEQTVGRVEVVVHLVVLVGLEGQETLRQHLHPKAIMGAQR